MGPCCPSAIPPPPAHGAERAFQLGRGWGGFGPLVIGILASQYSFALTIALLSGIYVLDMVVTVFLVPERRGEALT